MWLYTCMYKSCKTSLDLPHSVSRSPHAHTCTVIIGRFEVELLFWVTIILLVCPLFISLYLCIRYLGQPCAHLLGKGWPLELVASYVFCFVLWNEHEILNAHKYKNLKKFSLFQAPISLEYYFSCSWMFKCQLCWHFIIYEQGQFYA